MRKDEALREEELRRRRDAAQANFRTIVLSTLAQVGGLYAVSQATLLSIFVPQKCPQVLPCTTPMRYTCGGVPLSLLSPLAQQLELTAWANGTQPCKCTKSPLFSYSDFAADGHLCSMKENLDWRVTH
jgi:hypothetical protein